MKTTHQPFFSVIIATYNRASRLPITLNSVLHQTFQDFEIIVIDDASTDNTKELIQDYSGNHIIYLRNEINMERCVTRNRGIQTARGKYICFLDSDDYYLPSHLSELHNAITESGEKTALFFTNGYYHTEDNRLEEWIVPAFDSTNPFAYILTYTFNPVRTCIHQSILNKYKFDPDIPGIEDLDLCLRIAIEFPFIHVQKYTCVYVLHEESYSIGDPEKIYKDFRSYKIIFRKPELRNKLPAKEKNRLLSMSHYFIAIDQDKRGEGCSAIYHAVFSFFLFPIGYNRRTNKVLLAIILYDIPLIGSTLKTIKKYFFERR